MIKHTDPPSKTFPEFVIVRSKYLSYNKINPYLFYTGMGFRFACEGIDQERNEENKAE